MTYLYSVLNVCAPNVLLSNIIFLYQCSAGIGRTGTYIAIDALYEEGQQKFKINIAEYVKKMREKRMNMVQTYVNITF